MSAFPPDLFAGRRYAVVGLGRNGEAAASALRGMGAEVATWDDDARRRETDTQPEIAGRDALVLSPGIPHRFPAPHPLAAAAIAAGVPILSDAELLFQAVRAAGSRARFVGVTGTNGKSTTTALLAHILAAARVPVAAGGNLGPAALALPLLPDDGVYVLEMSSYMLERLASLRFDAGCVLNITPDHLDRHGGMAGYVAAKREMFVRSATRVAGLDDAPTRALAAEFEATGITGQTRIHDAPALPGAHNAQNANAAAAMARALGVPEDAIADGIASFPGLPHRQQHVATVAGVAFVNDSKATNADAAARALLCYPRLVWIVGGIAKAGGIAPLAPLFPRIARALLIGRDAEDLAATLAEHGVAYEIAGTLEAAIPAAFAAGRAERLPVLLSPACASFDQFTGFEQRGDRFASLVAALDERRAA